MARLRIQVSSQAKADIEYILSSTLAAWGEDAYFRYSELFDTAFLNLSQNPRLGKPYTKELRVLRVARRQGKGGHIIFYRVARATVVVRRVLHEAADFESRLT